MKNFEFEYKGKKFWYSRSVAVVVAVFTNNKQGITHVLANKRGPGVPNFQDHWNMPCGYLDFDETIEEAAVRECFEETGVQLNINDLQFVSINSDPINSINQNVTVKYKVYLPEYTENILLSSQYSEDNEVTEIKWIPLVEVDKFVWAFNHNNIIKLIHNDNSL